MIAAGQPAPDFTLPSSAGGSISLQGLRGRPVALFFYPADDTDGCTREALAFSVLEPQFAQAGIALFGISPDPISAHHAFIEKHGITVPLLSDPDRAAIEAYGFWQEKQLYGRAYIGLVRTSVVIDRTGIISAVIRAPRIAGHAEKVLAAALAV